MAHDFGPWDLCALTAAELNEQLDLKSPEALRQLILAATLNPNPKP